MRKCAKCGKIKEESEFYKWKDRYISYCKICNKIRTKEYYEKNGEKYRKGGSKTHIRQRALDKHRNIQKDLVFEHYGDYCICCGEKERTFLCVDHINNDGAEHRKVIGKRSITRWLVKNNFPEDFQILCWNCNSAKRILGYCPHNPERKI